MKGIVLATLGLVAISGSAWAQTPPAKPDEKTLTLQKETDGSLKIAVGPKPVSGVPESNWLPSAEGKPFSLTFRTDVPKEAAQKCEWTPPPLTKIN